ncbi:hypothetical protein Tco_0668293 [Tanacetum coccineum]
MLVEKKYPLRKEVLVQMLKLKLESEEDSTMALELIKFVKKIPAEHKNWLVHKQTACGKDFSNPFMVDNLPKIVGFSTHLAYVVKSWLVHDQTVHGDKMPKATMTDISLTKSYILKVFKIPGISPTIAQFYKPIKNRNIHEGRVVDQAYYKSNNIEHLFTNIRFNCLFQINKLIVPRFILDFYSQVTDLASLEYSQETEGPYCTELPTPDDIHQLLELERVVQWEELIRENVFGLGGHRDHLPACLAHMLYCVVAEEHYNFAYFFVKRIECARATPTANIPYDMFLTLMRSLALKQTRRPRSDRGKVCHSFSSSSSHHQDTSSHQHDDDDDDDVETSRASTSSPTTYLNSLGHLNYQNYQIPSASEQTDETLFERQTTLLNQTQQMYKEMCRGFKSFGKALKGVFSKKKK